MQAVMEKDDVLKQMALIDFKSEIHAEILEFEDTGEENLLHFYDQTPNNYNTKETNPNDAQINQMKEYEKNQNTKEKTNSTFEQRSEQMANYYQKDVIYDYNSSLETIDLCDDKGQQQYNSKPSPHSPALSDRSTDSTLTADSLPSPQSDIEQLTICIEDSLNSLSQHILIVMQAYYNYGLVKSNTLSNQSQIKEARANYHLIQSHYFHLSYKTMLHIILPQENNNDIITSFINNTAAIANDNKLFAFKCKRHHVETIFNYLIKWSKHMKAYSISKQLSENQLKNKEVQERSSRILNDKSQETNMTDSTCIFSIGDPGQEIRIDVLPQTFNKDSPQVNYLPTNNGSNVCHRSPPPPYQHPINCLQNSYYSSPNLAIHREPPPPYSRNPPSETAQRLTIQQPLHSQMQINGSPMYTNNISNNETNGGRLRSYSTNILQKCYACGSAMDRICFKCMRPRLQ